MRHGRAGSVLLMLLLFASPCLAQQEELTAERVLEVVRETMEKAAYGFLITLDESGQPQARLMDPFEPELDMTVWMATSRATRKVSQLRKDARATLAYYDRDGMGYVALVGNVRLVGDLEERRRRWKPEWESFYPGGPEGPNYLLIEFTPSHIQVMSISRGVGAGPFAPAILKRDGSAWLRYDPSDGR